MRPRKKTSEKGALELVEESVHLLRLSPLEVLGCYYIGTIPFALGFLFFWADMSQSAFAAQHCGRAAFVLVLLFVWMKTWQAIFGAQLANQIAGRASSKWSIRKFFSVATKQLFFQPSGLFALPFALLIAFPFGWVFAFYQNLSALGGGDSKSLFKTAAQQSALFPRQNHVALLILGAFGLFVWFNFMTLLAFLPGLIKILFGIETSFTRGGSHTLLNTTFLSASMMLTYLCVDPLVKTFYALRCFYGRALTSGEDLKVELKRHSSAAVLAAVALTFFCLASPVNLAAQERNQPAPSNPNSTTAVVPERLDAAIERVLNRPEFTWRQPREKNQTPDSNRSWLMLFLDSVGETVMGWLRSLRDVLRNVIEWLGKYFLRKNSTPASSSNSEAWMTSLRFLVFILIALIASALAILFMRMWKRRHRDEGVVAQAIAAPPDLADENLSANELPEDGWLKLARELMDKGDLRLALRALYLASLAHLAERQFVSIARFKSNREYEQELRRRTRALPELQNAFGQNVTAFDRAWYGMHEVNREILQGFESNLERIRAC